MSTLLRFYRISLAIPQYGLRLASTGSCGKGSTNIIAPNLGTAKTRGKKPAKEVAACKGKPANCKEKDEKKFGCSEKAKLICPPPTSSEGFSCVGKYTEPQSGMKVSAAKQSQLERACKIGGSGGGCGKKEMGGSSSGDDGKKKSPCGGCEPPKTSFEEVDSEKQKYCESLKKKCVEKGDKSGPQDKKTPVCNKKKSCGTKSSDKQLSKSPCDDKRKKPTEKASCGKEADSKKGDGRADKCKSPGPVPKTSVCDIKTKKERPKTPEGKKVSCGTKSKTEVRKQSPSPCPKQSTSKSICTDSKASGGKNASCRNKSTCGKDSKKDACQKSSSKKTAGNSKCDVDQKSPCGSKSARGEDTKKSTCKKSPSPCPKQSSEKSPCGRSKSSEDKKSSCGSKDTKDKSSKSPCSKKQSSSSCDVKPKSSKKDCTSKSSDSKTCNIKSSSKSSGKSRSKESSRSKKPCKPSKSVMAPPHKSTDVAETAAQKSKSSYKGPTVCDTKSATKGTCTPKSPIPQPRSITKSPDIKKADGNKICPAPSMIPIKQEEKAKSTAAKLAEKCKLLSSKKAKEEKPKEEKQTCADPCKPQPKPAIPEDRCAKFKVKPGDKPVCDAKELGSSGKKYSSPCKDDMKGSKCGKKVGTGKGKDVKVVIIGAGMAGLSAARRLVNCGIKNVLVLEATDRYGGRIHSKRFGDSMVELGAQFVMGASATNAAFNLAVQQGLFKPPVERTDQFKGSFLTSDGRPLDAPVARKVQECFHKIYEGAIDLFGLGEGMGEPLYCFFDKCIKEEIQKFPCVERDDAGRAFYGILNKLRCFCWDDMTLVNAGMYGSHVFLPGGTVQVPAPMSSILSPLVHGLPQNSVQYKKVVSCVNYEKGKSDEPRAKVTCCDGSEYCTDYVIVTIPLGFLKLHADYFFSPVLPPDKMDAISCMGFGRMNKVFLEYEKPFWVHGEHSMKLAWSKEELDDRDHWTKGISCFEELPANKHVIMALVGGSEAEEMEKMSCLEIVQDVVRLMREFSGDPSLPCPKNITRSSWCKNPFFLGVNSYYGTDTRAEHLACLRTPVPEEDPIVLFAGEATCSSFFGTIQGARLSGLREADRILDIAFGPIDASCPCPKVCSKKA